MKQFIALMMLVTVLASCGEAIAPTPADTPNTETEISTEVDAATNTTTDDIDAELDTIEYTEAEKEAYEEAQDDTVVAIISDEEFEVVKVQAIYNNPKQEVFIDINYVLDNDSKISEIQITDTNYDQGELEENIKVLVGKSLDEVEDTYIAGGSLTIPAVKKALSAGA